MIYIDRYRGRLGNHMFQRACAEILAKKMNTGVVDYKRKHELDRIIPEENKLKEPMDREVTEVKEFWSKLNYFKYYNDPELPDLRLNGYFQRSWIYLPHRPFLKNYFQIPKANSDHVNVDSVAVLVRRGDLVYMDKYNEHLIPLEYYVHCIDTYYAGSDIHIYTDTVDNDDVVYLKNKYNGVVSGRPMLEDLSLITKYDNIIGGCGTFHWWGAFLSSAKNIYFPIQPTGWNHRIRDTVDLYLPFVKYIHHNTYTI